MHGRLERWINLQRGEKVQVIDFVDIQVRRDWDGDGVNTGWTDVYRSGLIPIPRAPTP